VGQKAPVRDLLTDPAWREEDTGFPLPDSRHACVVSLPTWESVIGYEENDPTVVGKMRSGYPRFFIHPLTATYLKELENRHAGNGERILAYSSLQAARRAAEFIHQRTGLTARLLEDDVAVLALPEKGYQAARDYWRHTGELISSRQAEDLLSGEVADTSGAAETRAALARVLEVEEQDAFFFESGMAAIFTLFRAVTARRPGLRTLQLCFPYVDALKVQEHFGAGVDFVNSPTGDALAQALSSIREGSYAAVFCEVPSNPLLHTVDLPAVAEACRASSTPLLVDDTVCSHLNIDAISHADAVSTSLTKWVSGVGDVLAGSIRLNSSSPFAGELRAFLEEEVPHGMRIYPRDGEALVRTSADFPGRVAECNTRGLAMAEFLDSRHEIAKVWHPSLVDREVYDALRRSEGGYGGLVSFMLRDSNRTPEFYKAMRFSKGPSLGTDYSLLCPYTLLAHYSEIPWAESCGVGAELLRLSVGREPVDDLLARLDEALYAVG